ncbi:MAG: retroviral-like aspartic protease family protein [Pseudomonadota bacterium]
MGLLFLGCLAMCCATGAGAFELALEQRSSGAFYVLPAATSGLTQGMLLDTGSSYVGLSQKSFRTLQREGQLEFVRHIVGRMADGKTRRVAVYRLEELRLAADCVLRDLEVALLAGADRDILGLSALQQMQPFTLSMSPPQLRGDHCAAPVVAAASVAE